MIQASARTSASVNSKKIASSEGPRGPSKPGSNPRPAMIWSCARLGWLGTRFDQSILVGQEIANLQGVLGRDKEMHALAVDMLGRAAGLLVQNGRDAMHFEQVLGQVRFFKRWKRRHHGKLLPGHRRESPEEGIGPKVATPPAQCKGVRRDQAGRHRVASGL